MEQTSRSMEKQKQKQQQIIEMKMQKDGAKRQLGRKIPISAPVKVRTRKGEQTLTLISRIPLLKISILLLVALISQTHQVPLESSSTTTGAIPTPSTTASVDQPTRAPTTTPAPDQERLQLGGQCATRSTCRQKSRRLELDSGVDKTPCYCDEKCALYDDCCKDSRFTDHLSERLAMGEHKLRHMRSQWYCHRINPIFGDVLIRASCSPGWLESEEVKSSAVKRALAESIQAKCEHFKMTDVRGEGANGSDPMPPVADPLGMMLPITDLNDGITYANMYCLRCNKLTFSKTRGNRTSKLGGPKLSASAAASIAISQTDAPGKLNRRDVWIYWKPMLECNYDLDKDDRDALIDLVSSSKGQALEFSSERNKWIINMDYIGANLPTTTTMTSAPVTTTTTTTTAAAAAASAQNATEGAVRECNIMPTIPESIEHLIRFCRRNTIDSCPQVAAAAATTTNSTAAATATAIQGQEMDRAKLECKFGHQSLVYGQHSRKVYYNLACAMCNNEKSVFCRPRTRKADPLNGDQSAELSLSNSTNWFPGSEGADPSDSLGNAARSNFRAGGSVMGTSSMGSFSLVFDLNGEGRVGATQNCNSNQVFDPFFSMCRCLICGLNLRFVDGKCVPSKTYPYESLEAQTRAATSSTQSPPGDGSSPTSRQQTPSGSISVTTTLNTGSPLGDLISMVLSPLMGGGGGGQTTISTNGSSIALSMGSMQASTTPANVQDDNSSRTNAINRHHHFEGSHLDGSTGEATTTTTPTTDVKTTNQPREITALGDSSDKRAARAEQSPSKSAKLELAAGPSASSDGTVSATAATRNELHIAAATDSSHLTAFSHLHEGEVRGGHAPEEHELRPPEEDSREKQEQESRVDAKFDLLLSQMKLDALPEPTAESRRKFADCAKFAIEAKHYRLFTLIVEPTGGETTAASSEVKLVDLERLHRHWRRQQHQLTRPDGKRNRNFNRDDLPKLEGNKLWAYIEGYNLTLASSQFELIRTRPKRGREGTEETSKHQFKLLVCSPFSTDFEPKFTSMMAYLTTAGLTVSIASLSMYLLLYCLSMVECRRLVVDMLHSGSDVTSGTFTKYRESLQVGRSNSLSTANRSQSLPSRGVACLAASLLGAYLCFIAGHQLAPQDSCGQTTSCAIVAVATYYCFLVSFNWMFVLSYDIWRTLRSATCRLKAPALHSQSKRFVSYVLFTFGAAAVVSGAALLLDQMEPVECAQTVHSTASGEAYETVNAISCGKLDFNQLTSGGQAQARGQVEACSSLALEFNQFLATYKPKFGQLTGSCWFTNRRALSLFFGFPVTAIMLLNLAFFLHSSYMVLRTSVASSQATSGSESGAGDHHTSKSSAKTPGRDVSASSQAPVTLQELPSAWYPPRKCASCVATSRPPPKSTIRCEVVRANSNLSSDYVQANSLTTNSMMSVQTLQSHLSQSSADSSSHSSLKSDSSGDEAAALSFGCFSCGGHVGPPTGGAEAAEDRRPASGKAKRKLETRSDSASSIGSSVSKHSSALGASLASKYDAGYTNISAYAATIVKDYRLYCRLSTIMGLTWLMGLLASVVNNNACLWYLFVVLNTLQGLFIFIAFGCKKSKLMNAEILLNYLQYRWLVKFGAKPEKSATEGPSGAT